MGSEMCIRDRARAPKRLRARSPQRLRLPGLAALHRVHRKGAVVTGASGPRDPPDLPLYHLYLPLQEEPRERGGLAAASGAPDADSTLKHHSFSIARSPGTAALARSTSRLIACSFSAGQR